MQRILATWLLAAVCLTSLPAATRAQFLESDSAGGARYGDPVTHRYQAGVVVTAVGGPCKGLFATVPVPLDWPEQEVRIADEDVSPEVKRVQYRTTDETVRQALIEIPLLSADQEAHALITFEVRRRSILAPKETAGLKRPKQVGREIKAYLAPSPYIDSRRAKIRALAKEILANHDQESDWKKVEAIYDYVRDHVEYKPGPLKGALQALVDGYGDCEELSSLFIALCRAADVPARTVWIPGHCYPEFYLVDEQDRGSWFPCQAAGTRAFGEMAEHRPILQKGDNFRVPEKPRERQRYVAEFLRGAPAEGGGRPKVRFVSELLD